MEDIVECCFNNLLSAIAEGCLRKIVTLLNQELLCYLELKTKMQESFSQLSGDGFPHLEPEVEPIQGQQLI